MTPNEDTGAGCKTTNLEHVWKRRRQYNTLVQVFIVVLMVGGILVEDAMEGTAPRFAAHLPFLGGVYGVGVMVVLLARN